MFHMHNFFFRVCDLPKKIMDKKLFPRALSKDFQVFFTGVSSFHVQKSRIFTGEISRFTQKILLNLVNTKCSIADPCDTSYLMQTFC